MFRNVQNKIKKILKMVLVLLFFFWDKQNIKWELKPNGRACPKILISLQQHASKPPPSSSPRPDFPRLWSQYIHHTNISSRFWYQIYHTFTSRFEGWPDLYQFVDLLWEKEIIVQFSFYQIGFNMLELMHYR